MTTAVPERNLRDPVQLSGESCILVAETVLVRVVTCLDSLSASAPYVPDKMTVLILVVRIVLV